MKRLANPKWALLLENISREERGDIFMAILKYPDLECSSAVWPFIKAELDEDDIKYKAKCERLATNRLAGVSYSSRGVPTCCTWPMDMHTIRSARVRASV